MTEGCRDWRMIIKLTSNSLEMVLGEVWCALVYFGWLIVVALGMALDWWVVFHEESNSPVDEYSFIF